MWGCSHKNALCFSRTGGPGLADFLLWQAGGFLMAGKHGKNGSTRERFMVGRDPPVQLGSQASNGLQAGWVAKNVTVLGHEGFGAGKGAKRPGEPRMVVLKGVENGYDFFEEIFSTLKLCRTMRGGDFCHLEVFRP
jgi:hypothetical protein